jgi:hypothetical protein
VKEATIQQPVLSKGSVNKHVSRNATIGCCVFYTVDAGCYMQDKYRVGS